MRFRERVVNALAFALDAAEGQRMSSAMIRSAAAFTAGMCNRYEAAQPASPKRSYIPALVRDARYDANSWSRWEMTRKIRYFERNVWLVQALRDEHVKWTVGPNGLHIQPATDDEEWNKRTLEAYQEWCESPTLDTTVDMATVHHQIAGAVHLENDVFVHYTRKKDDGKQATPAVQLVESHRCSAPGTAYTAKDTPDLIDGVQLSRGADGRTAGPIGYWIIDNLAGDEWTFRGTDIMHHIFNPERVGMYRGITNYHSVMNTLHDLDDLELMEMDRAKDNSSISNIITTPTGEIGPDALRQRRFGYGSNQVNNDTKDEDMNRRIELYRKILGSRTIALKTGETLTQFDSKSPSAATQWYWRYKIGQCCYVAKVPIIMIFPELTEGIQGTVVRGIYDNAHESFRKSFFLYAKAAVRMYRYFVNWARYNDPRCYDAPANWNKCHVIPPRAVNVDIGYTSAAKLAELEAGTMNFDDIGGAYGTTGEVLIDKKARNVYQIKKAAKKWSKDGIQVLPEEISAPIADVLQKVAMAQAALIQAENGGGDEGGDAKVKNGKKKEPVSA